MTYKDVENRIEALPRFRSGHTAPDRNLEGCLSRLNHPERFLRVIHVAGTNGKGSTCAFMESILRQAGYRTAMFTSPHLTSLRERFQVCGDMVSQDMVIRAFETVSQASYEPLTFFETLFLMGLVIFEKESPDYCIFETGLGGRLDPTVLTQPVLTVITSVSLDHMAVLGTTIPQIAREKAGIMKPGVPAVVMEEHKGAGLVFKEVACQTKSPLYVLEEEDLVISKKSKNYIDFSIHNSYYNSNVLRIHSGAGYQVCNGGLAVLALKVLLPDLSEEAISQGLYSMHWPGRMQEIIPGVYVDGAHNPGAVDRIADDLEESGRSWSLLFSVYEDKDYLAMIRRLARIPFRRIYVAGMRTRRGASYEKIQSLFECFFDCPVSGWPDVSTAFEAAENELSNDECLLCLGSLHLVGELMDIRGRSTSFIESEDK